MLAFFGSLFSSPRRTARRPSPRPSARLGLEALEDRYCPTAPGITLNVEILTGTSVQLTGHVTGPTNNQYDINFGGVVSGSTTANGGGSYSVTTTASALGEATAQAINTSTGAGTNIATAAVSVAPPTITVSVTDGTQNNVTLSGTVTVPSPGGMTVIFSGPVNGSVSTQSDGSYSDTLQTSGIGVATATVTDVWGQTGSASVSLTDPKPTITLIGEQEYGGVWGLSGTVTAASDPAGLTVSFAGIPALAGQTATVQADGSFVIVVTVPPSQLGVASATVTDWWGVTSDPAFFILQ